MTSNRVRLGHENRALSAVRGRGRLGQTVCRVGAFSNVALRKALPQSICPLILVVPK